MPNPPSPPASSAAPPDLIVRGKRVITPEGERAAAVHIRGGAIVAITAFDEIPPGIPVHEAGDAVVMPGIVDTHVHINEPGRTEWEGFSTATRAAAAGGVTTLIEMPLNSIPATTTAAAFREKLAARARENSRSTPASGAAWCRGMSPSSKPLWDAGVFGFKCFLGPERRRRIRVRKRSRSARGASRIGGARRAVARARRAAGTNRRCDCEVAEKRIRRNATQHGSRPARTKPRTKLSRFWSGSRANLRRAFTSCISLHPIRSRNCERQRPPASRSASRHARTIFPSRPRKSPTPPPNSNARRRSARAKIAKSFGPASPMAQSTSSRRTILRARPR